MKNSLNVKKLKLIRRLCRELKLNTQFWIDRVSHMREVERMKFVDDARRNLYEINRRKLTEKAKAWTKQEVAQHGK